MAGFSVTIATNSKIHNVIATGSPNGTTYTILPNNSANALSNLEDSYTFTIDSNLGFKPDGTYTTGTGSSATSHSFTGNSFSYAVPATAKTKNVSVTINISMTDDVGPDPNTSNAVTLIQSAISHFNEIQTALAGKGFQYRRGTRNYYNKDYALVDIPPYGVNNDVIPTEQIAHIIAENAVADKQLTYVVGQPTETVLRDGNDNIVSTSDVIREYTYLYVPPAETWSLTVNPSTTGFTIENPANLTAAGAAYTFSKKIQAYMLPFSGGWVTSLTGTKGTSSDWTETAAAVGLGQVPVGKINVWSPIDNVTRAYKDPSSETYYFDPTLPGESITIDAGYYHTARSIVINTSEATSGAGATAADILPGKEAWLDGELITGAMQNLAISGAVASADVVTTNGTNLVSSQQTAQTDIAVNVTPKLTIYNTGFFAENTIFSGSPTSFYIPKATFKYVQTSTKETFIMCDTGGYVTSGALTPGESESTDYAVVSLEDAISVHENNGRGASDLNDELSDSILLKELDVNDTRAYYHINLNYSELAINQGYIDNIFDNEVYSQAQQDAIMAQRVVFPDMYLIKGAINTNYTGNIITDVETGVETVNEINGVQLIDTNYKTIEISSGYYPESSYLRVELPYAVMTLPDDTEVNTQFTLSPSLGYNEHLTISPGYVRNTITVSTSIPGLSITKAAISGNTDNSAQRLGFGEEATISVGYNATEQKVSVVIPSVETVKTRGTVSLSGTVGKVTDFSLSSSTYGAIDDTDVGNSADPSGSRKILSTPQGGVATGTTTVVGISSADAQANEISIGSRYINTSSVTDERVNVSYTFTVGADVTGSNVDLALQALMKRMNGLDYNTSAVTVSNS